MPTSFQFNDAQMAQLEILRSELNVPENKYKVGAGVPLYSYLFKVITGIDLTDDKDVLCDYKQVATDLSSRVEAGTLGSAEYKSALWLMGAMQVNRSSGVFSMVIREYNIRQGKLRGQQFDDTRLQDASNRVAKYLADDILNQFNKEGFTNIKYKMLPTVQEIGESDLNGVRDALYPGNQDDGDELYLNQAWPGTVMLGALGGKYTHRLLDYQENGDRKIDTLADLKNLLFTWDSFKTAFYKTWENRGAFTAADFLTAWNLKGALYDRALTVLSSEGYESFAQFVFAQLISEQDPTAGEALNLIAKLDSNKVLDMLMGATQGKSLIGTTTDANFAANAQVFFGGLSASQLLSIKASLLKISAGELVEKAQTDITVRAALAGLSFFAIDPRADAVDRLSLYNQQTGEGSLSKQYLTDRAAMLAGLYQKFLNENNLPVSNRYSYTDLPSAQQVHASGVLNPLVIFGFDDSRGDNISGAGNGDHLYGMAGDDKIYGLGGEDLLEGGSGDDRLFGGEDRDTLRGGADDDYLYGEGGNDALYGDVGDDALSGGKGNDWLEGGEGRDRYEYASGGGVDVIIDADGQGSIVIDGVELVVGAAQSSLSWASADGAYLLVLSGEGATQTVHISRRSNGEPLLTVRDYHRGDLGLDLSPVDPERIVIAPNQLWLALNEDLAASRIRSYSVTGDAGLNDIIAGDGDDLLHGNGKQDYLAGRGGDDKLVASLEGGWLSGGEGHDLLEGSLVNDVLAGGAGADFIKGGEGDDLILAGMDADRVGAPSPDWSLVRTVNNREGLWDSVTVELARDFRGEIRRIDQAPYSETWAYVIRDGNDFVDAGGGNDVVAGGGGSDTLLGGGGNDELQGDTYETLAEVTNESGQLVLVDLLSQHGNDVLLGGEGNDDLIGGGGDDLLDGGDGVDVLYGDLLGMPGSLHGIDTLMGGEGDDTLVGMGADDLLDGGAGADLIDGDADHVGSAYHGNDWLNGATGNDTLRGRYGNDTLFGGDGNDSQEGGGGDDVLSGEAGADTLDGGVGFDTLLGGIGADELYGDARTGSAATGADDLLDGGEGDDTLWGQVGHDRLIGGAGADILVGGEGFDTLVGDIGADVLDGNEGDDLLQGGASDDSLIGGEGADTLIGGEGSNVFTGGEGADVFVLDTLLAGSDRITDFKQGDKIRFIREGIETTWPSTVQDRMPLSITPNPGVMNSPDLVRIMALVDDAGLVTGLAFYLGERRVELANFDANQPIDLELPVYVSRLELDSRLISGGIDALVFYGSAQKQRVTFETAVGRLSMTLADKLLETVGVIDVSSGQPTLLGETTASPEREVEAFYQGTTGDDQITLSYLPQRQVAHGLAGNDTLIGTFGHDELFGGEGDDSLVGGNGKNILDGGAGNDILVAQGGETLLRGGAGSDQFVIELSAEQPGVSIIEDDVGENRVVLLGKLQAALQGRVLVRQVSSERDTVEFQFGNHLVTLSPSRDMVTNHIKLPDGATELVIDSQLVGEIDDALLLRSVDGKTLNLIAEGVSWLFEFVGIAPIDLQFASFTVLSDGSVSYSQPKLIRSVVAVGPEALLDGSDAADVISVDGLRRFVRGFGGADALTGGGSADTLLGGMGSDTLSGGDGNDVLYAQGGSDFFPDLRPKEIDANDLRGGAGNDTLVGSNGDDLLDGGTGVDLIIGGAGADTLIGSYYNSDTLRGGAGDDHYQVRLNATAQLLEEALNEGVDTVYADQTSWTLGDHFENLEIVSGSWNGTGNELDNRVVGSSGDNYLRGLGGKDTLWGGEGDDSLEGGEGDDVLDGGQGRDSLVGGLGIDTYVWKPGNGLVEINVTPNEGQTADKILIQGLRSQDVRFIRSQENHLEIYSIATGKPVLIARVLNALQGNLSELLSGVDFDGENWVDAAAIFARLGQRIEGSQNDESLAGTGGGDVFDGIKGSDTMSGGLGDDVYILNDPLVDTYTSYDPKYFGDDTVVELSGQGYDVVYSRSYSYVLPANIEAGILGPNVQWSYQGNPVLRVLRGNDADNLLDVTASNINTLLDGGNGSDVMRGGFADDTYIVDHPGDQVIEIGFSAGGQISKKDTVLLSIGMSNYLLPDNVENLGYFSRDGLMVAGNVLDNRFDHIERLPDGAVVSDGGRATLAGGLGNDTYALWGVNDDVIVETEGGGIDTVELDIFRAGSGSVLDLRNFNQIENARLAANGFEGGVIGNEGDNVIEGNLNGKNTLSGGAGNDRIFDAVLGLYGLLPDTAADILQGDAGNDYLVSSGGLDTLVGGIGNDTLLGAQHSVYVFAAGMGQDVIANAAEELYGIDSATYTTGGVLLLQDMAVDQVRISRSVDDLIVSCGTDEVRVKNHFKSGCVSLSGIQIGDFYADGASILVATQGDGRLAPQGNLFINGSESADFLSGFAGNDTLVGLAGNDRLNGQSGNDSLDGGLGNDTLIGGTGVDTLIGGGGDDTYHIDDVADVIISNGNSGTVVSSINYALSDELRNITLDGNVAVEAVGNDYSNKLTGNVLGNVLRGGAGDDTLNGMEGADTLYGGANRDLYYVDDASDVIVEYAGDNVPDYWDASAVNDVVYSSAESYTLSAYLDELHLVSSVAIQGVGNDLDNTIVGNAGANQLWGMSGHDVIDGGDGIDYLSGGAGVDRLIGGAGADTLEGGQDSDIYYVDAAGDVILEISGEGDDSVWAAVSYSLVGTQAENIYAQLAGVNVQGNDGRNVLMGSSSLVDGMAGDDTLSGFNSTFVFGRGYGRDKVTQLTIAPVNYGDQTSGVVRFKAGISQDDLIIRRAGAGVLLGIAGTMDAIHVEDSQYISGFLFEDQSSLDMATVLTLADAYTNNPMALQKPILDQSAIYGQNFVFNIPAGTVSDADVFDVVSISATLDNGADLPSWLTLNSGAQTLVGTPPAGQSAINIKLTFTDGGGASVTDVFRLSFRDPDVVLSGGVGADTLTGGSGHDLLDGGEGIDTLIGKKGDDSYFVDQSGDIVTELSNEGIDTVQSTASYTLSSNVENLTLTGVANINGTGNSLANLMQGNIANNMLSGLAGADTMIGGLGDDAYVVDNVGDVVTELAGEGTDSVQASLTHTLAANVENLTLTGTSALNGTGNGLANNLTGNSGANVLDGGAGADTMSGGAGNDTYTVDNVGDVIVEAASAGTDAVNASVSYMLADNVENLTLTGSALIGTGNALANRITGTAGNNLLDGGAGNDTMIGGLGDDTYVIDSASDSITENAGEGSDLVNSSVTLTLATNVENLILTGTGAINGTGNASNNLLTGNAGNNALNGGTGNDTMVGGAGNDSYTVDSAADVISESINEGSDSVSASVTYTLSSHVENLTLTGTAALSGVGNDLANALTGNSGANTLNGGLGADTMVGGTGDDVYIVDDVGDIVTEASSAGTDRVESSVTYTLGSNVENLTLIGSAAINATGNTLANTLVGNSGVNVLNGGAGADSMSGGLGDDVYVVDNTLDVITENAGAGTDTVQSSITLTLGANLENLTLTGTSAINALGNTLANVLIGNAGANSITGGLGNDRMEGDKGNDTYLISKGHGADTIRDYDTAASNTDTVQFSDVKSTDISAVQRIGNNLILKYGTTDQVIIENYFDPSNAVAYRVEQFKFSDSVTWTNTQIQAKVVTVAGLSVSLSDDDIEVLRSGSDAISLPLKPTASVVVPSLADQHDVQKYEDRLSPYCRILPRRELMPEAIPRIEIDHQLNALVDAMAQFSPTQVGIVDPRSSQAETSQVVLAVHAL